MRILLDLCQLNKLSSVVVGWSHTARDNKSSQAGLNRSLAIEEEDAGRVRMKPQKESETDNKIYINRDDLLDISFRTCTFYYCSGHDFRIRGYM